MGTLGNVFIGVGASMSFVFLIGLVEELSFALRYGLFQYADNWFPVFGFLCAGLFTLGTGINMTRKQKRLRLYMGVIGTRQSVFISDLAATAGVSEKKVISDLQDFLADGNFPMGYIDRASGRLVFTDQGYEPAPAPEPKVQEEKKAEDSKKAEAAQEDKDNDILREIKEVNDAIADPEMSRKIDRIGEITGKILDYQRRNPAKTELRQFLNYYLPTTLKILQAYAQLEAQGVEGENISAAKERIEGMMDKVVEGFEKQLDQLFRADAMDIATDVEVLERMLDKDGLGTGMTMGGV
ncbi:MAG: 5-bromo-4-chloroindolyl phosphate hydrolysis family protein [Oscillospiraceae bacterium]|nr:5-bromo-4-chloroindolyl phosphate hydrolysis family protein [Oscillospiraceae bacterium]